MLSPLLSRLILLVFGALYPAYASYKTIKNKDRHQYLKWMMHWIVFAIFISIETITDIFISWLPLYYEVKIITILWFISTDQGSSFLYRKFIHPLLHEKEQEIDEFIVKTKEKTLQQIVNYGYNNAILICQSAINNLIEFVGPFVNKFGLDETNDGSNVKRGKNQVKNEKKSQEKKKEKRKIAASPIVENSETESD